MWDLIMRFGAVFVGVFVGAIIGNAIGYAIGYMIFKAKQRRTERKIIRTWYTEPLPLHPHCRCIVIKDDHDPS